MHGLVLGWMLDSFESNFFKPGLGDIAGFEDIFVISSAMFYGLYFMLD